MHWCCGSSSRACLVTALSGRATGEVRLTASTWLVQRRTAARVGSDLWSAEGARRRVFERRKPVEAHAKKIVCELTIIMGEASTQPWLVLE